MSDFFDGRTLSPKLADVEAIYEVFDRHDRCRPGEMAHDCLCFMSPPCGQCVECPGELPTPWRVQVMPSPAGEWEVLSRPGPTLEFSSASHSVALAFAISVTDEARRAA